MMQTTTSSFLPKEREQLEDLTIRLLDGIRTAYLKTPQANPLRHWDQLTARARAAARRAGNLPEWVTLVLRQLQIPSPDSYLSSAIDELAELVGSRGLAWLAWLEDEHAYLIARTRMRADERRERRP